MKFRDCYKRPGIVLLLTNKVDMERSRREGIAKPGEFKNTVALLQRYTDVPGKWSFGNGHSDCTFEHNYYDITNESFEKHAGVVSYKLLGEILNGTNQVIGLGDV